MEQFQNKEYQTAHHEQAQIEPLEQPDQFKAKLVKFYQRLGQFSYLEVVGMIAIAILVLDQFFAVSITVNRKPLLQKMLGGKTQLQNLPPQLSSSAAPGAGQTAVPQPAPADPQLIAQVLPAAGVELPVTWGSLGAQMVKAGVIDQQKFEALYSQNGGMPVDQKALLEGNNGKLTINSQNSGTILNLLWGLGLGSKNPILEKGAEMYDQKYGGDPAKFASTGGWTLSAGNAMDHYSKHQFIQLTPGQQILVDRVSKNIYRPCCGNATHFPDCNHGMAMLALLELMASRGLGEQEMYKAALAVNSYWFPDNYLTLASYFKKQGMDWSKVNPQTALSVQYSSSQGYQQLLQQVAPQQAPQSKGGCGV